jgi:nitrate/nitrite-specific signal transduction histidine kinase
LLVRDNGRGAPPSAFERADALGMAHVRERAAQLGGWLYVESQPGLGTKVILTLPLYQEPPVATLALVAASLFKHPLAGESA